VPEHSFGEEIFPNIPCEPPLTQLEAYKALLFCVLLPRTFPYVAMAAKAPQMSGTFCVAPVGLGGHPGPPPHKEATKIRQQAERTWHCSASHVERNKNKLLLFKIILCRGRIKKKGLLNQKQL